MDGLRAASVFLCTTAHRAVAALVTALAFATAAGLLVEPLRPGSAVHVHWLGRGTAAWTLAAAFATTVLARNAGPRWRWSARVAVLGALVLAAASAVRFSRWASEQGADLAGSMPSASLLAALLLAAWLAGDLLAPAPAPRTGRLRRGAALAASSAALVAVWLACAGSVDYRAGPRGDAIVVFGSKVRADGTPSGSLRDRTLTACRLWSRGAAPLLVLSGGRAPGAAVSEPRAMRALALAHGVPESALVLDEQGPTTAATVENVAGLAPARGWGRILAVSHDYHLARIRLLGDRAGIVLRTVPAEETCPAGWKWAARAREVVAWGAAWLL